MMTKLGSDKPYERPDFSKVRDAARAVAVEINKMLARVLEWWKAFKKHVLNLLRRLQERRAQQMRAVAALQVTDALPEVLPRCVEHDWVHVVDSDWQCSACHIFMYKDEHDVEHVW
jgi:hypothetical protein